MRQRGTLDKYRLVGPVYDLLGGAYSAGAINRSKLAMLDATKVRPGDRCLFVGAGQGKDAIRAARLGAAVTVVDISPTMLRQFQNAVDTAKAEYPCLDITVINGDILAHDAFDRYAVVVLNFFLNVFDEPVMQRMLAHSILLARPDGRIIIGDFNYPSGNRLARGLFLAYWYTAMFAFWLAAGNALHRIYRLESVVTEHGLEVLEVKTFKLLGMDCCSSILCARASARRPAEYPRGTPTSRECRVASADQCARRLARRRLRCA